MKTLGEKRQGKSEVQSKRCVHDQDEFWREQRKQKEGKRQRRGITV